MADAPSTAPYLLLAPDPVDLPNAQALIPGRGLGFTSTGGGGLLTISPIQALGSLANLNSASGFLTFNNFSKTVGTTSFTSDGSITIYNQNGVTGTPFLSVNAATSVQLIEASANGGSIVGTRPTLNFIGIDGASVSVTDNPGANRLDIAISGSAENNGTVTSVGLSSTGSSITVSGTPNPITASGTFNVDLPDQGTLTPGSYLSANLTVNSKGLITLASDGGGGVPSYITFNTSTNALGINSSSPTFSLEIGASNGEYSAIFLGEVTGGLQAVINPGAAIGWCNLAGTWNSTELLVQSNYAPGSTFIVRSRALSSSSIYYYNQGAICVGDGTSSTALAHGSINQILTMTGSNIVGWADPSSALTTSYVTLTVLGLPQVAFSPPVGKTMLINSITVYFASAGGAITWCMGVDISTSPNAYNDYVSEMTTLSAGLCTAATINPNVAAITSSSPLYFNNFSANPCTVNIIVTGYIQ